MDLGSPDTRLEEVNDPQKVDGSIFVGKLDLNLAVGKEEVSEGYSHETETWGDRVEVELNPQGENGSLLFPADVRCVEPESSHMKSGSPVKTESDHDEVGGRTLDYDQGRLHSPLKDMHYQGKTGVLPGSYSGKLSHPVESETFCNERTEDSSQCSGKSSSTVVTNYQGESMSGKSDPCGKYSPPLDDSVKDYSGTLSGDLRHEKTESAYKEVEDGATDCHTIKLLSPEDTNYNGDETKREDVYYVRKSPSEKGKLEQHHSDLYSPQSTPKKSESPVKQMSVSPRRSPYLQQSPHQKPFPSPQGIQDPSYSPRSSRQKHFHSLESSDGYIERVPSQGHLSPSGRTSASPPRQSQQDSQRRNDSSPKRHDSVSDRRKHDRSMSRSPIRRRDSSASKRDYRDRSRSRSPYARDHYRRSPRRRYSPRRRSPPSGYYSRRRSPRRRPWSPPPNRNTGIGRPGNNLFIAGFNFVTTERDLERKFSRFGRVRDVRIVRDKRSGESRGFGFLSLERDEDADAAIRALDQTEWNGRIVLVEKSKAPAR